MVSSIQQSALPGFAGGGVPSSLVGTHASVLQGSHRQTVCGGKWMRVEKFIGSLQLAQRGAG